MSSPSDESNDVPTGERVNTLLAECFEQYRSKLVDIARASIEMSGDLFEGNTFVAEKDIDEFKAKRSAWVDRFDQALRELYAKRMSGARRKGRRADFDASLATLRVLTAFDQEKQAALVAATAFLLRLTRRELDALDLRIDALMPGEPLRDLDNPFGPPYILDAIGMSARAIYPNPRIWRPFMERVVADLTPAANKVYITLNRHLADHGVLPEIKAALRARSEFRPADDRDLIPTFSKMLHDAGQGAAHRRRRAEPVGRARHVVGFRLRRQQRQGRRSGRRHRAVVDRPGVGTPGRCRRACPSLRLPKGSRCWAGKCRRPCPVMRRRTRCFPTSTR